MECYPMELAQSRVLLALWILSIVCCMAAVVQEKQVTTCNTPCDVLQLTCPRRHRIAVREALFSVTTRDARDSPCTLTHTCGNNTLCCEQSQVQECTFGYSHSHLEAVHRNCSGTRACAIKTERTAEETVACPFFNPDLTVSHTVLDYVCINDSATLDLCAATETQRLGRTLFALLDGRRRRRRQFSSGGAVCRCTAESVAWPTTNTIAVFVVDMRLTTLYDSKCSKADVTLRSGSITRLLDCVTSRDPRQAFPFVAQLNNSNVATVELFLHHDLPEFVWLGFESNELEDIRLTCGLQGYVPINHDVDTLDTGETTREAERQYHNEKEEKPVPIGALIGAIVGGVLLCVVIVAAVVVLIGYRRRHRQIKTDDYSEPHDVIDDVDIYYSTPDINVSAARNANSKARQDASNGKPDTSRNATQDPDDGEVYITAEAVRERKRQSGKKKVRIVSVPDISDDVAAYYASPWDIRDRRRQEEEKEGAKRPAPPPTDTPLATPPGPDGTTDDNGEEYSVLATDTRKGRNLAQHIDASYDHLGVIQKKGPIPEAREGTTADSNSNIGDREICATVAKDRRDSADYDIAKDFRDCSDGDSEESGDEVFPQIGRQEPDGCNHNAAFEGDNCP